MRLRRRPLSAVMVMVLSARALGAQMQHVPAPPESAAERSARCAAAMARLDSARATADAALWERGWDCPGIGRALARRLTAARLAPDVDALKPVLMAAFYLRDNDLFTAALTVASDTAAAPVPRAASLVILAAQVGPSNAPLDYATVAARALAPLDPVLRDSTAAFVTYTVPSPCVPGIVDHPYPVRILTPLPADARQRVEAVLGAIPADARTPKILRAARMCIGDLAPTWH